MNYLGYRIDELNDKELAEFYSSNKKITTDLPNNGYLLIQNKGEIIDEYRYNNGELQKLKYAPISNNFNGTIKPKNPQQKLAFDMLQNKDITIKFLTGVYGSGKTFLMTEMALDLIRRGVFKKIVWVRNNIEVKNSTPLGSLPGGIFDKLLPYAMPIADHVGGIDNLERLIAEDKIEVQHLGYIRGRDIKDSIILSSESENLTKEHIQLLIGRVSEGSNLWIEGDLRQTDKEVFENNNGLEIAINRLKGNPLFGYVHFPKTERSATAQLADLLD